MILLLVPSWEGRVRYFTGKEGVIGVSGAGVGVE